MEPKYRIELGTFYGRQRQINIIKNSSITLQGNHIAWTSSPKTLCISTVLEQNGKCIKYNMELETDKIQHIEHFSWKKIKASAEYNVISEYYLAIGGIKTVELYKIVFSGTTKLNPVKAPKAVHQIYTSSDEFSKKIGRICAINFNCDDDNNNNTKKTTSGPSLFISGKKSSACFMLKNKMSDDSIMYVNGPVQNMKTFHCWNGTDNSVAMTAGGELRVQHLNDDKSYHTCFCADVNKSNENTIIPTLSDIIHINTTKGESSLFVGHGNTTLALSTHDATLQGVQGDDNGTTKKCLNQVYRDMKRVKAKSKQKSSKKKNEEDDGSRNTSSIDNNNNNNNSKHDGGMIDLTAMQSNNSTIRTNLKFGDGLSNISKPTGALASLMNLSANKKVGNSSMVSSLLSSSSGGGTNNNNMEEEGKMTIPSLIFFKYAVRATNEKDNNKLYGIGSVATKFPTDFIASYYISSFRNSVLMVVANRSLRTINIMHISNDMDSIITSEELHNFQIKPDNNKKTSLVGLTIDEDQLLVLISSREQDSTFFSADNTEFTYELYKYDLTEFVHKIIASEKAKIISEEIALNEQFGTTSSASTPPVLSVNDGNANNNKSNGAMNDLSIITRAIENMQAHFDARLDRIEGMLMQHSMRLNRIENMKSGK